MNHKLMCPKSTDKMISPLNEVADDFITKIRHIRKTKGASHLMMEIQNELYKWGMEGKRSKMNCTSGEWKVRDPD